MRSTRARARPRPRGPHAPFPRRAPPRPVLEMLRRRPPPPFGKRPQGRSSARQPNAPVALIKDDATGDQDLPVALPENPVRLGVRFVPTNTPRSLTGSSLRRFCFGTCMNARAPNTRMCPTPGFSPKNASQGVFPVCAHGGPVRGVVGRPNGLRPHLLGQTRIFEHRPNLFLQHPFKALRRPVLLGAVRRGLLMHRPIAPKDLLEGLVDVFLPTIR